MEDFNSTSQDKSYNYTNITSNYSDYDSATFIKYVMTCIIISIGLPLTLVAIYAVYSLVRKDHVAPIYVINLLISDLIQLCCMIVTVTPLDKPGTCNIVIYIHTYCLVASVSFMVCIALERYLVIVWPLWYRCRRTIKTSVVLCVVVWALIPGFFLLFLNIEGKKIFFTFFFLLPFPLLIFFLGGTLKALSASSVPSDEKRRIVGTLVLVLLIYMLLFLPAIMVFLTERDNAFVSVAITFLHLNPLADLFLYVFMKKGIIDKLLASVCCCRMDSDDIGG